MANLKSPLGYQVSELGLCDYCTKYPKHYKSACLSCYEFFFNILYESELSKYLLLKELISQLDICDIIMNIIFILLGFQDINILKYHHGKDTLLTNSKLNNDIKLKSNNDVDNINFQETNQVDESDLDFITELNIDDYLGSYVESNDKYKGLWSDDDC